MGTPIRARLFVSCFLLIAAITLAVDAGGSGSRATHAVLLLGLSAVGAILMTWIFARAIEWRIQRLKLFAEHVLDEGTMDAPLPEEGRETAQLNQSLRRMASRMRELVERLSLESPARRHSQKYGGGRAGGGSPDARPVLQSVVFRWRSV